MFAFLGVGPIGGLVGMIGATWAVLRTRLGPLPGGGVVLRLIGVLAGIAALVGAGIWIRLATLDTYTDTLPPQLEFELRAPAALAAPRGAVAIELDTDKNVANASLGDDWRDEGATRVLAGLVSLDLRPHRLLVGLLPTSRAPRTACASAAIQMQRHSATQHVPTSSTAAARLAHVGARDFVAAPPPARRRSRVAMRPRGPRLPGSGPQRLVPCRREALTARAASAAVPPYRRC